MITETRKKAETETSMDYAQTQQFDKSPSEIFDAINNVAAWWSTEFDGSTTKMGAVFTVRFGEVYITSKVVEFVPGKEIVWLVTDCNKSWLKNPKEWVNTKMSWEITAENAKSVLHFTHYGLVPEIECYDACSHVWGKYLDQSLTDLILKGKGKPNL